MTEYAKRDARALEPYYYRHVGAMTRGAGDVPARDSGAREDFAWRVVKAACETEPADEDDPECIRILRIDLKSAVLAAFLSRDATEVERHG